MQCNAGIQLHESCQGQREQVVECGFEPLTMRSGERGSDLRRIETRRSSMHARLHAPHPFRAELGGREAVGEVGVYYFEIACVGLTHARI
jgi:hypothetical protein